MTLGQLKYILSLSPQQFFRTLKQAGDEYNKSKKNIEGRPISFNSAGLDGLVSRLALLSGAYLAVSNAGQTFKDFQTGIANVSTLGVENIEELRGGVLKIGIDAPVTLQSLTDGLYNVVSAGVESSQQISVLETTSKAAKAGLAETTDALNLGAAVVKSYGLAWQDTEEILDKAFATVRLGQTTFPELSQELQKVTPIASALGVSINEIFGSFATLTGVTGNTAIVATQVRSIMSALADPTAELTALIKENGFASVEAAVKAEGLAGIMGILQKATGGSAAEMQKYFGRVEAVTAALALSGSQFDTFKQKTQEVAAAQGELNEAFEKQAQTLDSRLQVLGNRLNVVFIGLLNGTLPAIEAVVGAISALVGGFAKLEDGSKAVLLALGAIVLAFFKLPAAIYAARASFIALNASLGPAGWLFLGLTAIVGILTVFLDGVDDATEKAGLLATANKGLAESFDDLAGRAYDAARALSYEDLTARRQKLLTQLDREKAKLEELKAAAAEIYQTPEGPISRAAFIVPPETEKNITELEANIEGVNKRLAQLDEERTEAEKAAAAARAQQRADEVKQNFANLDKLRAYQFETNRISLEDYINYLLSRLEAQRAALGAESAEYLKYIDNINRLQNQLKLASVQGDAEINVRVNTEDLAPAAQEIAQFYQVQLDFEDQIFSTLEAQYNARRTFADFNIETARQYYGEESEEYKKASFERVVIEQNFQQAKADLMREGVAVAAGIGSQLVTVFQGQNKTLFSIGKGLSIANATINAYEAASRAYKDYPFPVNIAISGIQLALALGQVAKIKATEFSPSGFAAGTSGPLTQADLLQSIFTPPGEDGIAGLKVGEFVVRSESTAKYLPLLKAINEDRLKIPRFADGGLFKGNNATQSPTLAQPEAGPVMSDDQVNRITQAIRETPIVIRTEADFIQFFRDNFPEYERLENERRV